MIFEIKRGRICDSLVLFQANEIQKGLEVERSLTNELNGAKEQIALMNEALNASREIIRQKDIQIEGFDKMWKNERRQKNKWKAGAIFSFIVILEIVFSP